VDAIVIGRKTFETVMTFDSWPYGEKPVVVLSARTDVADKVLFLELGADDYVTKPAVHGSSWPA